MIVIYTVHQYTIRFYIHICMCIYIYIYTTDFHIYIYGRCNHLHTRPYVYVITHVFHHVLPERVNMDKAALAGHIGDCCCHVLPRLLKAGREYWQHQHEQHSGDS